MSPVLVVTLLIWAARSGYAAPGYVWTVIGLQFALMIFQAGCKYIRASK